MSDFSRVWTEDGVHFDLSHPELPEDKWESSRFACTVQARLMTPAIARTRSTFGDPDKTYLLAGDRVSVSRVAFGTGRRTAEVDLVVERRGRSIGRGTAIFWRASDKVGLRDISAKLLSPEALAGDITAPDHPAAEYARKVFDLAAKAAGDPALIRLVADAWALLGYRAGLKDGAGTQTPARAQAGDAARAARRAEGDPDRAIALGVVWNHQNRPGSTPLRKKDCARAVLAIWEERAEANPDDPFAKKGLEKGVPGIERNIRALFRRDGRACVAIPLSGPPGE